MYRFLTSLILGIVLGTGALAQNDGPSSAPASEPTSTETLLELLKDDAAREALITELEEAATASDAVPAEEEPLSIIDPSIGREIAVLTQGAAEAVGVAANSFWAAVTQMPKTWQALLDAMNPDVVLDALIDIAFVIVATYVAFMLLRQLSHRISRRIAEVAADAGWFKTVALSLGSSIIDVIVVVLAWAAGYLIVLAFSDGFGVIDVRQSLYLNAFLIVELAKVTARAFLAPRFADLRLLNLGNKGAQRIWRWLNTSITILGYGQLLAVPIVNNNVSLQAGDALASILGVLVILITVVFVLRYRRPVAAWLHGDKVERSRKGLLARLAYLWHWPVLIYLVCLLAVVIARPGNILLQVLWSSSLVVGAILAGLLASAALSNELGRGVQLSSRITQRLPLLERRINAFLPRVVTILRILIGIVVLAVALDIIGLFDLKAWLGSTFGIRLTSKVISVSAILLVSFLVWLAISSWVDFKLNPDFGRPPTAREVTLLSLFRNAATIAVILITLMFTLSEIGLDIAPLLASAGVLGLAIGFGAQKLVQDIITGIFIQLENAMNVGDVVTVAGTTGAVEKLTVRSVNLRDVEGVFHIIPFSSVDMVSNYTRDFSFFVCDMGVGYGEDEDSVRQAMLDAFDILREMEEHKPFILGDMEWFGLQTFGDSAVVLRARIKTTPGKQWGVGRAYNSQLKRLFDKRGIEIPFPHRIVYQRSEDGPARHALAKAKDDDGDAKDAEKSTSES